jgi:hypothetical protein
MSIDYYNFGFWLEADDTLAGGSKKPLPGLGDPAQQAGENPPQSGPPLQGAGQTSTPGADSNDQDEDDVTQEPQSPEGMDDDETQDQDFTTWKSGFFKLAIKGDPVELMNNLDPIRNQTGLTPPQRKFVEDNWNILVLRQNANIDKACKEVRKLIKQNLDRNNPGVSIMQHMTNVIEESDTPQLRDVFIKLAGLYGLKSDLHRKYMAALTGSIQTGGGGSGEDLAYSERDYSIRFNTRFGTQFGEISVGKWSLQQDDPERYLQDVELDRLSDGSPEEKQVLRRRIVIESIAERFKNRAFLIHVVSPDEGAIYCCGWDMADSLLSGYKEGKIIVRSRDASDSEAMIDDEGAIVPLLDLSILYLKDTGDSDDNGRPKTKEVPFMERRDGNLYLNAQLEIIRDVSTGMQGIFFKELPFNGNPSDIKGVMRSVPNLEEILMRRQQ